MGWYKGWRIGREYPPIGTREFDWVATSPDYDVDCDEDGFYRCAGQQVHAATHQQIIAEIDAAIEESTPSPRTQIEDDAALEASGGCANCHGMIGDLAEGRDPEELCDTCYDDLQATTQIEEQGDS